MVNKYLTYFHISQIVSGKETCFHGFRHVEQRDRKCGIISETVDSGYHSLLQKGVKYSI